jgi:predicted ATPase/class 3 adenylate cyclase
MIAQRPTGTVTFLFSDIEGSTERWERYRDAMAAAIARHDALLRSMLEQHGAYVFKTVGDAFYAAFARPEEAIAAALDVQRALADQDFSAVGGLRVRMAVHTGSANERDGDYFGPALNRVARLLAIGHGGQVLVSGTSTDLLQGTMPPQSSLHDLGTHRLKDLAQPEQVYQLVAEGLAQSFPALLSLDRLPNNLPPQLTSFVGREKEIAEIVELLGQYRFITLVGTGGAGKTRCAIQIGGDLLDGSGDGVWLAELAPISDSSLVASVIAETLGVKGEPNKPALEAVVAFLKRKRLLLILDNCEHVIDETRNVVDDILRSCPEVRILATSREGLNIAGERVYRMPSLPVPRAGEHVASDAEQRYGAVALFVDRAVASDARFTFSDENAPHVAEICRRLDGIPLAIELAAARVKVLSPHQLAQKLNERFRVLTGGNRRALPRQQTMRALVDWSYDLLAEDERTLFRKLGVFAGGFTLETAVAVCGEETIDEIAILDMLSSLVDKSLVQAEPAGSGTRYRLLESMRQYARERMEERGEHLAVAHAHAVAFCDLAEQLRDQYERVTNRAWLSQAQPELENLRAALEWALTQRGDVALAQRTIGAMRWMWYFLAPAEGRQWVRMATDAADASTPETTLAALELAAAHLDLALTQRKVGYEEAQRAVARMKALGDDRGIAEALRIAGSALMPIGGHEAGEVILREALELAQRLGMRKLVGRIYLGLGGTRAFGGDIAGARTYYSEAMSMARANGDDHALIIVADNLAEAEYRGGDAAAALRIAEEVIERGTPQSRNVTIGNIAQYLVALDRYDDARRAAREAVAISRDAREYVSLAFALQHLAAIAVLAPVEDSEMAIDSRRRGARLLGYVGTCIAALDAVRETEQMEYDRMLPVLNGAFDDAELAALVQEGSSWSEDRAVAEAMLI